jgi:hypothetical protein
VISLVQRVVLRAVALCTFAPAIALADHDHGAHVSHGGASELSAKVSLVAAKYENASFLGDYQGVTPAIRYGRGRWSAGANASLYRLTRNGEVKYGPGDVVVDGQVQIVGGHPASAGVALAVSLPTGSRQGGLGMGHVMAMPSLWGVYMLDRVTFVGMFGYGRALGDGDHSHHASGAIVDPMNVSELTWSAQGDLSIARTLTIGARLMGGVPVGEDGDNRVVGGVRTVWTEGRVTTSAEVQIGFDGDPFDVRGVLATALRL